MYSIFITCLFCRVRRRRPLVPCRVPEHDVPGVCSDAAPHQRVPGDRVPEVRGGPLHRLQEDLRRQADEHPRPRPEVDQVPPLPGALRLRQRKLHQRLEHSRQRPVKDHHHRQLTSGNNTIVFIQLGYWKWHHHQKGSRLSAAV